MNTVPNEIPSNKPFFSIGITTYNRKDLLKQALFAFLSQDFSDFEIIIGNDYLAEKLTAEMLGIDDKRIRIINNEKNLGELGNMNSLLQLAQGTYFTWQFDDDLCMPNFLSVAYSALKRNDYPFCLYTSFGFVYGEEAEIPSNILSKESIMFSGREFLRKYLSGRIRANGLGGFYNTESLIKSGGAPRLSDGHMALYSEYLLIIRSGLESKVLYINSPLILFRVHGDSWSSANTQTNLFKQAGINLIHECVKIFSVPSLKDDFQKNLTSLFNSVICAVIVKGFKGRNYKKSNTLEYLSILEEEVNLIKEADLRSCALRSFKSAKKNIVWFNLKAKIKVLFSDRQLKFVRIVGFLVSRFTNKSF